jgi:hypothetical protein
MNRIYKSSEVHSFFFGKKNKIFISFKILLLKMQWFRFFNFFFLKISHKKDIFGAKYYYFEDKKSFFCKILVSKM